MLIAFADSRQRYLVDDLLATECGMHGRQGGCPHLEPARVVAELEMVEVEAELILRAEPSGDLGRETIDQFAAHIQIAQARPAKQPFERPANEYIDFTA